MKKIMFIFLIPFFLTGCFDYNELNDLAIITGMAVDYENDEFMVTFEILSTKKEGDSSGVTSSYNTVGVGKTLVEAFENNGIASDKVPYYEHMGVVILSEEVAKKHFKEVSELLIRNSKMRNEFYTVIASDVAAQEILKCTSKEKPAASDFIVGLLEHSNKTTSSGYYAPFTDVLSKALTDGEDAIASCVGLKDENIVLTGLGVFKDFELVHIFNNEEAAIFNLLNNFKPNMVYFELSCDKDNKTMITTYEAKIDVDANEKNITVKGSIEARIQIDNCGYDLKDTASYETLEKEFTKEIEKKMKEILTVLQNNKSNALSIGKKYYNHSRKKDFEKWCNQDIVFDLDLNINKKGLIFQVE